MIHEINEIVKSLSPDEIVGTVKGIKADEVLLRLSNSYSNIESFVRNYPTIKMKMVRLGRISKVRYHNRSKNIKRIFDKKS
jgi:hypothetical protein